MYISVLIIMPKTKISSSSVSLPTEEGSEALPKQPTSTHKTIISDMCHEKRGLMDSLHSMKLRALRADARRNKCLFFKAQIRL